MQPLHRVVASPALATTLHLAQIGLSMRPTLPFRSALLALVAIALLAGIVPAALLLDRWLGRELELRAWRDAALAPTILDDRNRAIGDALMMHAKDVAHTPDLGAALASSDFDRARELAEASARSLGHAAILVTPGEVTIAGPVPPDDVVAATRRGEMPVRVISDSIGLWLVSVAPVEHTNGWTGVAGVANPLDSAYASVLANLTRSDFVVIAMPGTQPVLSRSGEIVARVAQAISATSVVNTPLSVADPRELQIADERFLVSTGPFAGATVFFVRDMRPVLAILPQLRVALLIGCLGALVVALLLASRLALLIVRPVRGLAEAAERLSTGDFDAQLAPASIREVGRVSQAFDSMRTALARRIEELRAANRMLEERQARLSALQSELISRERVAATGRIVAELAHEIRNPVASLRNCLELLHRRLAGDPQGQEYAALAIDELLRMHELAERMLHLNRPHHSGAGQCDAAAVVREVASLVRLASQGASVNIDVTSSGECNAAIPPDALKQVLLNLVQNARDAVPDDLLLDIAVGRRGDAVAITVCDNGPGVPRELGGRIFDPFFTTREAGGGVGLGLFVVEGVVRGFGGKVALIDAPGTKGATGACFRIDLPAFELHQAAATASTPRAVPDR
jgi:signal transduction histidine kinase